MFAPNSLLHSQIRMVNVSKVLSLPMQSSNAVVPRISSSGVGLSSPLSIGLHSGSTWISDVASIVGELPPSSGSHTLPLSSPWARYLGTIIPDMHASPCHLGVLNEVNWPIAQSISGLRVLNHVYTSTWSYTLIEMTSTSGLWTGPKWSLFWTVIAVLQLSLACAMGWPLRLADVMCAASLGSSSLLGSYGDIKMLVPPQWISACIHCNSLC